MLFCPYFFFRLSFFVWVRGGVGLWGVRSGSARGVWVFFCSLCFFVSLKFFSFSLCPALVRGVASCSPLISPWPVRRCGYALIWLCCPCCMAVIGSWFLLCRRFGLSFFCAGSWPLLSGLLLWRIFHSLYDCVLEVWCCLSLAQSLYLLLGGLLRLLWMASDLTACLLFFFALDLFYDGFLLDQCLSNSLVTSATPYLL